MSTTLYSYKSDLSGITYDLEDSAINGLHIVTDHPSDIDPAKDKCFYLSGIVLPTTLDELEFTIIFEALPKGDIIHIIDHIFYSIESIKNDPALLVTIVKLIEKEIIK